MVRDRFWDGGPAISVFTVEEYRDFSLPAEEVNEVLGYAENYYPGGCAGSPTTGRWDRCSNAWG